MSVAGEGLVITNTPIIRSFLLSTSEPSHSDLPSELRQLASDLASRPSLHYRHLRSIWSASPTSTRPPLPDLFSGCGFVFDSPKPREKSEELKERLRKLAELEERRIYRELVKDVVPKEENVELFSSYKDQIGFGLHVIAVMFAGFLVGYAAFRALFNHNTVMSTAGGIFGLVCSMLLETVLFIIRTSSMDSASSCSTTRMKKYQ